MDGPRGQRPGPDDPLLVSALLDRGREDPRRANPAAAHHDRVLLAVGVQVARAERLRVARSELEDVADLDRRLDLDGVAGWRRGCRLDARPDVDLFESEVASGPDADQVHIRLVGAGEVPAALDCRVLEHGQLGADRPDEPGRAELGLDLVGRGLAESAPRAFRSLISLRRVVAADERQDHSTALDLDGIPFNAAPAGTPSASATASTVLSPGVGPRAGIERRGELDLLRLRRGDLDVRGVAGRERDLVLARRTRAMYSWAPCPPSSRRRTRPRPSAGRSGRGSARRRRDELVARVETLVVAIERVGVLHRELARSQDAGAGTRLVALLDLEVVEQLRQLAIGTDVAGDVEVTASSWVIARTCGEPLRSSSLNSSSIS